MVLVFPRFSVCCFADLYFSPIFTLRVCRFSFFLCFVFCSYLLPFFPVFLLRCSCWLSFFLYFVLPFLLTFVFPYVFVLLFLLTFVFTVFLLCCSFWLPLFLCFVLLFLLTFVFTVFLLCCSCWLSFLLCFCFAVLVDFRFPCVSFCCFADFCFFLCFCCAVLAAFSLFPCYLFSLFSPFFVSDNSQVITESGKNLDKIKNRRNASTPPTKTPRRFDFLFTYIITLFLKLSISFWAKRKLATITSFLAK